jgi:phospholipid/cholesterol/gamma-HCH transport system substrate-binding protein
MVLVLVIGVLGVAAFFGGKALIFDSHGSYLVSAEFRDADGLRTASAVKIGGVPGGKVTSVQVTSRDTALVTMALDKQAAPLGARPSAQIRPVNLLGEKYVDLNPGNLQQPIPSGSSIAIAQTGTSVELDDILNMLDPDTRARLRIIINEFGTAVAGRGADFNTLLQDLPPALEQTRALVTQIGSENVRLRRLLGEGDAVISAMASRRTDLQDLVVSANSALQVTASRRAALGATVQRAGPALAQLRSTLTDLGATALQLEPAARQLRLVAPSLRATLEQAPAFAIAAEPTLLEARLVAPTLTALGKGAAPVLKRLAPVASRLASFSKQLGPLTTTLDANWPQVLGLIEGWARDVSGRDGLGHLFRIGIQLDQQVITSLLQRYTGLLPAARRDRATRRNQASVAPVLTQSPTTRPSTSSAGVLPQLSLGSLRLPANLGTLRLPPLLLPTLPRLKVKLPPLPGVGKAPPANHGGANLMRLLDYLMAP